MRRSSDDEKPWSRDRSSGGERRKVTPTPPPPRPTETPAVSSQRTAGTPPKATAATSSPSNTHYQAHEPKVEEYLNRSRMISNIRKERLSQKSEKSSLPPTSPPKSITAPNSKASSSPSKDSIFRSGRDSNYPAISSERQERWMQHVRSIQKVGRAYEKTAPRRNSIATSSTSTQHPFGETAQTTNEAVKGWSTHRRRTSTSASASTGIAPAPSTAPLPSSSNAVVGNYLKRRQKSHDSDDISSGRLSYIRDGSNHNTHTTSESDDLPSSSSEDEDELKRLLEKRKLKLIHPPSSSNYSLKVCLISAVDFPSNVVPNLPFAPILKCAVIPLPEGIEGRRRKLMDQLASTGIESFDNCIIQTTTPKILAKRDNGAVEFHEELRWNHLFSKPDDLALVVQLSAAAVMRPANIKESPPAQKIQPLTFQSNLGRGSGASSYGTAVSRSQKGQGDQGAIGSLFGRKKTSEIETANAAAAVAKLLVVGEEPQERKTRSDIDVKLRPGRRRKKTKLTEDLRIGTQVIPLSKIALTRAMQDRQTARVEQWFELESAMNTSSGASGTRNPSVLLEIGFSAPEVMDESEDDMDDDTQLDEKTLSFSKRASLKIRQQQKQEVAKEIEEEKITEPVLNPGIVDYICVVGAKDIGNQKLDDGSPGWVKSSPECCVLEQFPPSEEFHVEHGRNILLPNKVEWWCFPEGCKLWRGSTPPNSEELNLSRFSASSPANIATTLASFDACLGCTTSFTWFVIASNSDEYGSDTVKTYGACIRFYVPAPSGIDQTQADFAQLESLSQDKSLNMERKRLWVPLGICMTSNIPIVGIMEVLLLRLCESLMQTGIPKTTSDLRGVYEDLANLVVNFQKPIPGVVQTSFNFLAGDRITIAMPPRSGLPPIPHGRAVTSVCRLLGPDGITYILAALLTECKILIHSDDIANLCLVAEVMTALIYPFSWSLPYIPVLPVDMMEFLEAPLSFLLGIPTCNLKAVDPFVLEELVVVDLDHDFTTNEYYEGKRSRSTTKAPTPLPANTVNNISRAVHRLLRAEEEMDKATQSQTSPDQRHFPRADPESVAEREFRISIALEMFSLVRGYQDCLVYASSSPVFNSEKFLQTAPALFEEQRAGPSGHAATLAGPRKVLSPRSRRFLSLLVSCQHFHQFLETLDTEQNSFFHQIANAMSLSSKRRSPFASDKTPSEGDKQRTIDSLIVALQKQEERIPVYRIKRLNEVSSFKKVPGGIEFPMNILQNISVASPGNDDSSGGVTKLSLDFLVELEKNPWKYTEILGISVEKGHRFFIVEDKVKLREAIGERKYRAWKMSLDHDGDDFSVISEETRRPRLLSAELGSLLSPEEGTDVPSGQKTAPRSDKQSEADKFDCEMVRQCLGMAEDTQSGQDTSEIVADIVSKAEIALKNPSARRFMLSILSKRAENRTDDNKGGGTRLEAKSFDLLLRLGRAVVDWCSEDADYDTAYSLLKLTAGLNMVLPDSNIQVFLTTKVVKHPLYADLKLWDRVQNFMVSSRKNQRKQEDNSEDSEPVDEEKDEYDAVMGTLYEMLGYGVPAEDLARFAWRMSVKKGWNASERGQSIMLLVRRILNRREHGDSAKNAKKSYLDSFTLPWKSSAKKISKLPTHLTWEEMCWCHPAAQSSRRASSIQTTGRRSSASGSSYNTADEQIYSGSQKTSSSLMKRSAVTSVAYLGSGVVVSGGLDGGVFLARPVKDGSDENGMRGVHLDWGSSGSRYNVGSGTSSIDGEYGVGAVSCLASTKSNLNPFLDPSDIHSRLPTTPLEDEDLLKSMESCRVVAGTTCGDLRVWSVKDVFTAIFYSEKGGDILGRSSDHGRTAHLTGEGSSSSFISNRRRLTSELSTGSSLTRLKFSLRGRALSGHRGGVSCIDVPSAAYRPDSVVTGGADGLIKLWSLRSPATSTGSSGPRRTETESNASAGRTSLQAGKSEGGAPSRSGDALSILSGHGGRILCIKTAWHGDRLLSGGADRTVRVWDLAGSGGKCLSSLSGHFGWVSHVQYWGSNVIVSASTDRSLAVWDARASTSPLFSLRHHTAPISDVLVGSRTDPTMLSASGDGTVAVWDFRRLGAEAKPVVASSTGSTPSNTPSTTIPPTVVRRPSPIFRLQDFSYQEQVVGPVFLARGPSINGKTAFAIGGDGIVREWDTEAGAQVSEHSTGHCDRISQFFALRGDEIANGHVLDAVDEPIRGILSASWDGTVRMRCRV